MDHYKGKRKLKSKDFDGDIEKEYFNIGKIPVRSSALLTMIIVILISAFLVGICTGHINIVLKPSL